MTLALDNGFDSRLTEPSCAPGFAALGKPTAVSVPWQGRTMLPEAGTILRCECQALSRARTAPPRRPLLLASPLIRSGP